MTKNEFKQGDKNRICYFSTRGRAGHFACPIVGKFTREELNDICQIDSERVCEKQYPKRSR